jgi:hypothetical protein
MNAKEWTEQEEYDTRKRLWNGFCFGMMISVPFWLALLILLLFLAAGAHAQTTKYSVIVGDTAAIDMKTGSYVFCVGHDACKNVANGTCIIDIKPLSFIDAALLGNTLDAKHRALAQQIIDIQQKHCGYDKRRVLPAPDKAEQF